MLVSCISLVSVWELTLLVKLVSALTYQSLELQVIWIKINLTQTCVHKSNDGSAGLDPAYPGFSIDNTDGRLDVTDAQFVDIIHTNSDSLLNGGLSFTTSIGHVDFWPNGGIVQPVSKFK